MRILYIESVNNELKSFILILLILICVISAVWSIVALEVSKTKMTIIALTIFIISVCGTILVGSFMPEYIDDKHTYYVEITDTDNIAELLKDYNIIETYGSLYKIEDK